MFKNITIKKRGGGTRTQRVKVLKSGKFKFVKNLSKTKTPRTRKTNVSRRKGVKKMARRKRRRRSNGMTIPIAPIAGLMVGLAEPVQALLAGDIDGAANHLAYKYLGYDRKNNTVDLQGLWQGTFPLVLGALIHKFVGGKPLNVNAMLARSGVPFIRI